jgi:protoporphyrinogen oxidase
VAEDVDVIILGGGISGLSLADAASSRGRTASVLEGREVFGGLVGSVQLGGHVFDTGPHGIYCPDPLTYDWFKGLLGDDLQPMERRSYSLFRGQRVAYPLTLKGALGAVTALEAARVAVEAVLLRAWRGAPPPDASFEEWAIHSFGPTLYRLFFETYTRKVWGLPCRELSAAWVSVHLPANSLLQVLFDRLRGRDLPIGFVSRFHCSARGSGDLVDRLVARLEARPGVALRPKQRITRVARRRDGWRVSTAGGEEWQAPHVVSTIPAGALVSLLDPPADEATASAARSLRFRNLVLVLLVLDTPRVSDANWLYVPDPALSVCRISEFKNMIPSMRGRPDTSLELELYCWPGDPLWTTPDDEIVAKAVAEIQELGLARAEQVTHRAVLRLPHAYPVFDRAFESTLGRIHDAVEARPGLHVLGRTGAFRYLDQAGCVKGAFEWARGHLEERG